MVDVASILNEREEKTKKKTERAKKGVKPKSAKKLTKKELQILELSNRTVLPEHYEVIWTEDHLDEAVNWLTQHEIIAVDTETMGTTWYKDEIVGISMYAPTRGFYIPLKHRDEIDDEEYEKVRRNPNIKVGIDYVKCLPKDLVIRKIKPLLEDKSKKFILHNAKFDIHILRHWCGINLTAYFDTMIAQALLDENQSKALKDMAVLYLKVEADRYSTLFGKVTFDKVPILLNPHTRTGCLAGYYAIKDTELTYRMYEFQMKALERPHLQNIKRLMFDVEMPFLHIVVEAEAHGVRMDEDYLKNTVAVQLHKELDELKQRIWSYTGKINLDSPRQVAHALYEKLKLPRVNKENPNSTNKKTLNKLKNEHEVVPLLLEYRQKAKLTQAFADKLPKAVVNGRIHTSFNTIGAKTGRMSSSNPNLQQIPARVGPLIRNAFIADEGRLLASIDFSQQELRVLAHVSQDPVLLSIYREGKDVHSMTAVSMWNRKYPNDQVDYETFEYRRNMVGLFTDENEEIDENKLNNKEYVKHLIEEGKIRNYDLNGDYQSEIRRDVELGKKYEKIRKDAKVVNFGIIYGMSEKGLAETLEISEEEAAEYIKGYFAQYPGVQKWMAEQRKKILTDMFTTTMLGRKRRVYPEIKSGKRWLIGRGIRQGINAIIQGSSADMTKLASIKLQPLLKELDARIVLWIHDEIVFDVPEDIGMEGLSRIAEVMCNALPLDCGMKADIEVGKKWGQKMSEDDLNALRELFEDDEEEDE